ncbi:MAG: M20/M25/M40 family metallo-hydrolase [Balneolaceae bacterium]
MYTKNLFKRISTSLIILLLLFSEVVAQQIHVDSETLLRDVKILASDALEGRKTGTVGNKMAQVFILDRFKNLELKSFNSTYRQTFRHVNPRTNEVFENAVNLIGYIEGSENPEQFIVITAHYDHLGIQDGEIYNGADDNASGVGGLLAAASWFSENPPDKSLLIIAFDAEEQGLGGARYFVENPVVPLDQIIMNINMDMISTNFDNELYAVGTYHYEHLKPIVINSTENAPVNVLFGHDSPDLPPGQDWTFSSDHGPFHQKGIPFIYFGVEDHRHYHKPTDVFENINPEFYVNAVNTIISFIRHIDKLPAQLIRHMD